MTPTEAKIIAILTETPKTWRELAPSTTGTHGGLSGGLWACRIRRHKSCGDGLRRRSPSQIKKHGAHRSPTLLPVLPRLD